MTLEHPANRINQMLKADDRDVESGVVNTKLQPTENIICNNKQNNYITYCYNISGEKFW